MANTTHVTRTLLSEEKQRYIVCTHEFIICISLTGMRRKWMFAMRRLLVMEKCTLHTYAGVELPESKVKANNEYKTSSTLTLGFAFCVRFHSDVVGIVGIVYRRRCHLFHYGGVFVYECVLYTIPITLLDKRLRIWYLSSSLSYPKNPKLNAYANAEQRFCPNLRSRPPNKTVRVCINHTPKHFGLWVWAYTFVSFRCESFAQHVQGTTSTRDIPKMLCAPDWRQIESRNARFCA